MSWIPVVDWEKWMKERHIKLRPIEDEIKESDSKQKREKKDA